MTAGSGHKGCVRRTQNETSKIGRTLANTGTIVSVLAKDWCRSKTGVFFSVLFPVMLLLVFGSVFSGEGESKYQVYYQNFDVADGKATNLSKTLIDVLDKTRLFQLEALDTATNLTEFSRQSTSFGNKRFLVIPEGFEEKSITRAMYVRTGVIVDTLVQLEQNYGPHMNESVRRNITAGRMSLVSWRNSTLKSNYTELLFIADPGDSGATVLRSVLTSVVDDFNNRLIGAEPVATVKAASVALRQVKAADYYLPGYIAAFVMTNGIIGMTVNVSEHRRNGVVKRLAATPLSKVSWVLGNVVNQTILAFLLMFVMIGLSTLIFGTQPVINAYSLLLVAVGAIAFCAIGMTLGGILKDVESATGAGNAIAFPMMFLSGSFWPIEIMPPFMQSLAKVFPLYYFHEGLRSLLIYDNVGQSANAFLVLGVVAAVFILIAVRLTKWKDL